ncbi:hypothetical protein ABZ341_18265 [Streptomyces sp. NPDC006173]|uniref:hypothetical protein n=1 Tax=Streptomyces sp. NPDC006173 TaxID=3155349 RepID=UPI003407F7E3
MTGMPLIRKSETGRPCQACGHPTAAKDPAVFVDGARIHESHTGDPKSGFYRASFKRSR